MRRFPTALGLSSFLAIAGVALMTPTVSSAQPAGTYVACNQFGECWRVHRVYAYGPDAPITYYNSDWYAAHEHDEHVHWLADPADDRGYYDHGRWHADPAATPWRAAQPETPALARRSVFRDASHRMRTLRRGWRGRGWRDA